LLIGFRNRLIVHLHQRELAVADQRDRQQIADACGCAMEFDLCPVMRCLLRYDARPKPILHSFMSDANP